MTSTIAKEKQTVLALSRHSYLIINSYNLCLYFESLEHYGMSGVCRCEINTEWCSTLPSTQFQLLQLLSCQFCNLLCILRVCKCQWLHILPISLFGQIFVPFSVSSSTIFPSNYCQFEWCLIDIFFNLPTSLSLSLSQSFLGKQFSQ